MLPLHSLFLVSSLNVLPPTPPSPFNPLTPQPQPPLSCRLPPDISTCCPHPRDGHSILPKEGAKHDNTSQPHLQDPLGVLQGDVLQQLFRGHGRHGLQSLLDASRRQAQQRDQPQRAGVGLQHPRQGVWRQLTQQLLARLGVQILQRQAKVGSWEP